MPKRTNPFNEGDFVRIVIEAPVSEASDTWGDTLGYLNLDVPGDTLYIEKHQIKSIEKIEPPYVFPETMEAVISGEHKGTGNRLHFHRNGDQWLVLGENGVTGVWDEGSIKARFENLKTEWSGV